MAIGTFISGRYTGSYNSGDVGITRQGYDLEVVPKQEMIDESDAYGLTTLDWIIRGADAFLQWISREYKAGSLAAFWPYGLTLGTLITAAVPVGEQARNLAKAMVLNAVANTPAAAAPASLTASKVLLAPNYNARLLFDSRLREVPVRVQLLPYESSPSTTLIFFSTT
ncbi:MAG TPA: hypothetical protein VD866_13710 [Urbifossiella sp.]|nr:hypothetical protein [Urbifossiella sp.]